MNNSDLIDKAHAISACMSYDDDTPNGNAKQLMRELCHRLGQRTVRIEKAEGGYVMTTLFGFKRRLTWKEQLMWRLFGWPPLGTELLRVA
jgi:hypothetical protein